MIYCVGDCIKRCTAKQIKSEGPIMYSPGKARVLGLSAQCARVCAELAVFLCVPVRFGDAVEAIVLVPRRAHLAVKACFHEHTQPDGVAHLYLRHLVADLIGKRQPAQQHTDKVTPVLAMHDLAFIHSLIMVQKRPMVLRPPSAFGRSTIMTKCIMAGQSPRRSVAEKNKHNHSNISSDNLAMALGDMLSGPSPV